MPTPQSLPPPETNTAIRTLFFGRLAEFHRDLSQLVAALSVGIEKQSPNACLGSLVYAETRLQSMHNILLVLREVLGD